MADGQVYALDQGGNKIVTLSAAQILAAIQSAISTGEIPPELETLVDSIREQNDGKSTKIWVGTQAEFEAIEATEEGTLYFITDLTTVDDLSKAISDLAAGLANGKKKPADSKNVTDQIAGKNITDIFESNGTTAKKATEVTGKINGKNISDIFESDGTTAKKATEVTGKINGKNIEVTGKINGKNISDIFESNGTTAKKATTLGKYQHNVYLKCYLDQSVSATTAITSADLYFSFIDSTNAKGGSLFSDSFLNKIIPASGVLKFVIQESETIENVIYVKINKEDNEYKIFVETGRDIGNLSLAFSVNFPRQNVTIESDDIIKL